MWCVLFFRALGLSEVMLVRWSVLDDGRRQSETAGLINQLLFPVSHGSHESEMLFFLPRQGSLKPLCPCINHTLPSHRLQPHSSKFLQRFQICQAELWEVCTMLHKTSKIFACDGKVQPLNMESWVYIFLSVSSFSFNSLRATLCKIKWNIWIVRA